MFNKKQKEEKKEKKEKIIIKSEQKIINGVVGAKTYDITYKAYYSYGGESSQYFWGISADEMKELRDALNKLCLE